MLRPEKAGISASWSHNWTVSTVSRYRFPIARHIGVARRPGSRSRESRQLCDSRRAAPTPAVAAARTAERTFFHLCQGFGARPDVELIILSQLGLAARASQTRRAPFFATRMRVPHAIFIGPSSHIRDRSIQCAIEASAIAPREVLGETKFRERRPAVPAKGSRAKSESVLTSTAYFTKAFVRRLSQVETVYICLLLGTEISSLVNF